MYFLLLLVHITGVIVWVGGMFFAHFVLRPAAEAVLEPPKRLAFMAATLARFFALVAVCVAAVLLSGLAMLSLVQSSRMPVGWHVMSTLGVVMALVFAYIRVALFPRFLHCVAESAWPQAAAALLSIRRLVALNLALGVCSLVAAASTRL